jgi:hypothetical protein
MKLLTVIASNVFKFVGELGNSRGSVVTSCVTGQHEEQQEEDRRTHGLQKQQQWQQGQQEEHGREQEQGQKEQVEQKQQQEELDRIAQLSHKAQLDGLTWAGWHCLYNVCEVTESLTQLLSCLLENQHSTGCTGGGIHCAPRELIVLDGDEEESGGGASKEAFGDITAIAAAAAELAGEPAVPTADALLADEAGAALAAGATAESLGGAEAPAAARAGAAGVVAGTTAGPTPAAGGEGVPADTENCFPMEPFEIIDRCFSLLENTLFAEGTAGVRGAFVHAAADAGRHKNAYCICLLQMLQDLSLSKSAAGAGASFRGDGAAIVMYVEAAAAAAAGPAAGAASQARLLVLYRCIPEVLGDIVAAAALGVDTEVALPKERWEDGSTWSEGYRRYLGEAQCALVACLKEWERTRERVGPPISAAAVEDLAEVLLAHVYKLALSGLGRPVGFSCNNPTCPNLRGFSEVGLVVPGVKGAPRREGAGVCGRCKAACYCSHWCQWNHAQDHCCEPVMKPQQQ